MSGAVPLLPLYAFKALMGMSLPSSSLLPFSMMAVLELFQWHTPK